MYLSKVYFCLKPSQDALDDLGLPLNHSSELGYHVTLWHKEGLCLDDDDEEQWFSRSDSLRKHFVQSQSFSLQFESAPVQYGTLEDPVLALETSSQEVYDIAGKLYLRLFMAGFSLESSFLYGASLMPGGREELLADLHTNKKITPKYSPHMSLPDTVSRDFRAPKVAVPIDCVYQYIKAEKEDSKWQLQEVFSLGNVEKK